MSGDGDCHRSSSPLKRRASSMDPEHNESGTDQSAPDYPRAMSVDAPDGPGYAHNPDAGELNLDCIYLPDIRDPAVAYTHPSRFIISLYHSHLLFSSTALHRSHPFIPCCC